MSPRTIATAALLALPLLTAGCAASSTAPEGTAERFAASLAASDGAGACALLTERAAESVAVRSGQPCPEGILLLDLPAGAPESAETWGAESFVTTAADALFLTRSGESWLVRAAGCSEPVPDAPFDCLVDGS